MEGVESLPVHRRGLGMGPDIHQAQHRSPLQEPKEAFKIQGRQDHDILTTPPSPKTEPGWQNKAAVRPET